MAHDVLDIPMKLLFLQKNHEFHEYLRTLLIPVVIDLIMKFLSPVEAQPLLGIHILIFLQGGLDTIPIEKIRNYHEKVRLRYRQSCLVVTWVRQDIQLPDWLIHLRGGNIFNEKRILLFV
ncbi:MAG: hypothetical protein WCK88_02280 [bacterium]